MVWFGQKNRSIIMREVRAFRLALILSFVLLGLLVPKVSALIAHFHPQITTIVICSGSELITYQIGPDGKIVQTDERDHAPCHIATPNQLAQPLDAFWLQFSQGDDYRFSLRNDLFANRAQIALLPDSTGPPFMI